MSVRQFRKARPCIGCRLDLATCIECGFCAKCGQCRPKRCTRKMPLRYAGTTYRINPLRRALGLEYEIGSYNDALGQTLGRYADNAGDARLACHRDGSVKPMECEWVTKPIVGDDAHGVLTFMADLLNRSKSAIVNETCGLHVHVDACKESSAAVRRFLYLYLRLEEEIYGRLCARHRSDNSYCTPLLAYVLKRFPKFTPDTLTDSAADFKFMTFILSLYGARAEDGFDFRVNRSFWERLTRNQHAFGYDRHNNPRYCGMNLHSWYRQGSIEWRMKEMTIKYSDDAHNDLLYWPLFCGWFTHIGLNTLRTEKLADIRTLTDFANLPALPKPLAAWLHTKLDATPAPRGLITRVVEAMPAPTQEINTENDLDLYEDRDRDYDEDVEDRDYDPR